MTDAPLSRSDVLKALTQTVGYPFLSSKETVDAVFPLIEAAAARVPELEAERDAALVKRDEWQDTAARCERRLDATAERFRAEQARNAELEAKLAEATDETERLRSERDRIRRLNEAANTRVREQSSEIERLRVRAETMKLQRDVSRASDERARAEIKALRARLAAAPDLTELREAWGRSDFPATMRAIRRLLAAVPSTSTDSGGES